MYWCFGGGGGGNDSGGGGGNDEPAPNQGVERGRGAEPPAATGRNFSQGSSNQSNRDDNSPRDTMLDIVTLGNPVANRTPNQISQRDEFDIQNFVEEMASVPPSVAAQQPNSLTATGPVLPPERVTDMAGTTFNTITGEIIDNTGAGADTGLLGAIGIEDEYDPYAGTEQTAMNLLNYDLDDQSGPDGRIRPFGGLTRAQQADLESRNDFVAKNILANQTQQASGIPTTNLTGIYTFGNDPDGMVRGYSDFGPELPFLGQTQVYSGFGADPFTALNGTENEGGADVVPPQTNPMTGQSQCPDGYIFDDDLQACRMKTRSESRGDTTTVAPSSDMYFRQTALDTAPANTPAGFDFDAANRRFTQSYAYRPGFYNTPMDLTGFTKLL